MTIIKKKKTDAINMVMMLVTLQTRYTRYSNDRFLVVDIFTLQQQQNVESTDVRNDTQHAKHNKRPR